MPGGQKSYCQGSTQHAAFPGRSSLMTARWGAISARHYALIAPLDKPATWLQMWMTFL